MLRHVAFFKSFCRGLLEIEKFASASMPVSVFELIVCVTSAWPCVFLHLSYFCFIAENFRNEMRSVPAFDHRVVRALQFRANAALGIQYKGYGNKKGLPWAHRSRTDITSNTMLCNAMPPHILGLVYVCIVTVYLRCINKGHNFASVR